jgi:hypothetical protein
MNIYELKAEIELLCENSINLRGYTDNLDLYREIDENVVGMLEQTLFNIETIISDIDYGVYMDIEEDIDFEEEEKEW